MRYAMLILYWMSVSRGWTCCIWKLHETFLWQLHNVSFARPTQDFYWVDCHEMYCGYSCSPEDRFVWFLLALCLLLFWNRSNFPLYFRNATLFQTIAPGWYHHSPLLAAEQLHRGSLVLRHHSDLSCLSSNSYNVFQIYSKIICTDYYNSLETLMLFILLVKWPFLPFFPTLGPSCSKGLTINKSSLCFLISPTLYCDECCNL